MMMMMMTARRRHLLVESVPIQIRTTPTRILQVGECHNCHHDPHRHQHYHRRRVPREEIRLLRLQLQLLGSAAEVLLTLSRTRTSWLKVPIGSAPCAWAG